MSDVSYTDDSTGKGGGSSSSFGGLNLGTAGALGVGAVGLGLLLGEGESPLPSEFSTLTNTQVPTLQSDASTLFGEGQNLTSQGAQALNMAQNGALTPEQQAQLSVYKNDITNTANQEYAAMGRNPNQDTSYISTQSNIDAHVNAMAQQQIQSTIALGLGETSAGSNFSGQALGFENAANSALIAAGNAQIQQDKDYSNSLASAFSSIATMFGTIGGTALKAAAV